MFKMLSNMKIEEIYEMAGGKIFLLINSCVAAIAFVVPSGLQLIQNEAAKGIIAIGVFSLVLICGMHIITRTTLYFISKTKAKRQKNE